MQCRPLAAVFAIFAISGCNQYQAVQAIDKLTPCTGYDTPVDAYCGTLKVYENRATKQGRQLDLNIVVLPALRSDAEPDPLFFLAGGPGQGAAKLAKAVRTIFQRVQNDRDIVLVDQRGTGKSNPLNCLHDEDDSLQSIMQSNESMLEKLKACQAKYDADLTLYTTPIAMDDLDDVRAFLGYEKINLYGGSYGTRAALVYMRRHGDRVRTAILDGVAPPNMRLPLYFPRDTQRAFELLAEDCAEDAGCNKAYPNLLERMRTLVDRLEKSPPTVKVTHPRTGETADIRIDARVLANVIVTALYQPLMATLVPAIVAAAEKNDFQSMLALSSMGGDEPNMSIGMQLSVICAEDAPKNSPDDLLKGSESTLFGKYVMSIQQQACTFWPRGNVDDTFYEPLSSAIPTLVLSGEVDPVTPPSWGEQVVATLSNSKHVIIGGTGHTAGGTGCGQRLMREFIEEGSPAALDTSCVDRVRRPAFFLSPAGPDPTYAEVMVGKPGEGKRP